MKNASVILVLARIETLEHFFNTPFPALLLISDHRNLLLFEVPVGDDELMAKDDCLALACLKDGLVH